MRRAARLNAMQIYAIYTSTHGGLTQQQRGAEPCYLQ